MAATTITPISIALSVGETLGVDERKLIVFSHRRAGSVHAPRDPERARRREENG
jgi:hypothetical protein